jgi:cytochrome c oxidase subunit 2
MKETTVSAPPGVLLLLLLLAGLAAGCASAPQAGVDRGRVLYDACSVCHGADGAGNAAVGAPPIGGMPAYYLSEQLHKYRKGWRGYHVDDVEGLRMLPMLLTLETRGDELAGEEIDSVVAYVESMSPVEPPITLGGDAAAGQVTFATCAACHGVDGKGNEALKSPPLTHLPDWYIVRTLEKFKAGVRGAHPDDATGAQMRAIILTLPDRTTMENVAAYIQTL